MTVPVERTRALRFGWEFLMELKDSDNLTDEQRSTVEGILRHYPTGGEIKQWAKDCASANPNQVFGQLVPEKPNAFSSGNPKIPNTIPRGPTKPEQRTHALRTAYEFFRIGLLNADNLTTEQRSQIPFVLRHFPEGHEINFWAKMDARQAKENPAFKQWLAPSDIYLAPQGDCK